MFKKKNKSIEKNTGKKPYKSLQDIQESSPEQKLVKLENDVVNAISNIDTTQNRFFCTDDPFITNFDDKEILKFIQSQIPNFGINPGCTQFKQSIFVFLENETFVKCVMDKFELKIKDIFKFLFRLEPSVFKGMFMKKVKEIATKKSYFKY